MASTLKTNAIEPEGATTNLVIGESGQNTVISNNDLRANVLQDAGGNALFTSDGSGNLSGINSGLGSAMVLLSTQTASSSASLSFTSGITSTYGEYIFKFYNINPATNNAQFRFQANAVGESGYNETITSTNIEAYQAEAGGGNFGYNQGQHQSQGTAFQPLVESISNGADESLIGELHLFNPSSTTYVKHFIAKVNSYFASSYTKNEYTAGYFNITAAIDDIQFKMSTGNFDGVIKMWGVK